MSSELLLVFLLVLRQIYDEEAMTLVRCGERGRPKNARS